MNDIITIGSTVRVKDGVTKWEVYAIETDPIPLARIGLPGASIEDTHLIQLDRLYLSRD